MIKTIPWHSEGGNLYLEYEGTGAVSVSSDENEGLDRSQIVQFSNGSLTAELTVNQIGKRELFMLADGTPLEFSDGPFKVLK